MWIIFIPTQLCNCYTHKHTCTHAHTPPHTCTHVQSYLKACTLYRFYSYGSNLVRVGVGVVGDCKTGSLIGGVKMLGIEPGQLQVAKMAEKSLGGATIAFVAPRSIGIIDALPTVQTTVILAVLYFCYFLKQKKSEGWVTQFIPHASI